MRGLGTIINVAAILVGGIVGLCFGKFITEKMRKTILTIVGVTVLLMGTGGVLSKMFTVAADGTVSTSGELMMIVSCVAGAVIGELVDFDGLITRFGEWLKRKTGSTGDNSFVGAFVSASCTVSIGAMAIIGSLEDGISGNYKILLAKSLLDLITICVMTSVQGKGCIFSAIPVAVLQGLVTLLAVLISGLTIPVMALNYLSLVGSVLIFCVGLNIAFDCKIRVSNLLPAIVIAFVWGLFV